MTKDRVKVVTTVAAWPEALELQRELLDRYLEDDFEFIAFIDTPVEPSSFNLWDPNLRQRGIRMAEEFCDRKYLVPDLLHKNRRTQFRKTREKKAVNANLRAADSLQFAWNSEILDSVNPVLILDNDMFPISSFSIKGKLLESPLSGIVNNSWGRWRQKSIPWLWSGLMFIDPPRIPEKGIWSFDCGKVQGINVDVSGQTAHWLMKYSNLVSKINHLPSLTWTTEDTEYRFSASQMKFLTTDSRNKAGKFYCELYGEQFLHYRGGSNWSGESKQAVVDRFDQFKKAFRQ
jgi:hypothetical protein